MDPRRFDSLIQSLSAAASRRSALAALLAGLVAPLLPGLATPARGKGKGKQNRGAKRTGIGNDPPKGKQDQGRGDGTNQGKKRGKHRGDNSQRQKPNKKQRQPQPAQAEAACYTGASCTPGPGKNLSKCDFSASSMLKGKNLKGANLGGASVARGDATGANLQGANLGSACLVDATLRGALVNASTNMGTAILCRTTMPDGSTSNAGCAKGTSCCPTCDAAHPCPTGQVCCNGRCRTGNCCTDAQCSDPARPICVNNTCAPCSTNRQCGNGKVCCAGQCKTGACCVAADCDDRPCQTETCDGNRCLYTAASGATCNDGDPCTIDDVCQNGTCVGTAKNCAGAADACNDGVCRQSDGACLKRAKTDGTRCSDNNSCTTGDSCRNGACTPGAGVDCSTLNDQCNIGVCNPADGQCITRRKDDGDACDDGNPCTRGDTCQSGACVAGPPRSCPVCQACSGGDCQNVSSDPRCATVCCNGVCCPSGSACEGNSCPVACLPTNAVCDEEIDTCCDFEGEVCSRSASCAAGGDAGRCCRAEGNICAGDCDCCDGVCARGVCCQPIKQCNASSECCDGYVCINNVCTAACGRQNAFCGDRPDDIPCCPGFRCFQGECFPETCKAPTERCNTSRDCCPDGVLDCRAIAGQPGVNVCCRPFGQTCDRTAECCDITVCGPQGKCCLGSFFDPVRGARGCIGREDECCPGRRCNRFSNSCCLVEGQPVNPASLVDCCHFTQRDGRCICHGNGEACAAPSGNPALSSCCDGLVCFDGTCEPTCHLPGAPCSVGGTPCCGGVSCRGGVCF